LDASKFIGLKSEKIIDWENLPILFSAHGIPMRLVNKGDIYVQEIESNKIRLEEYLRKNGYRGQTYLSFQSRVGPGKWTAPNTINKLQEIGAQGVSRIAIYPISFVSDHLETLVEIGVELKEIAHHAGITEFFRIPSFGVYPKFIEFLGDEIIASSKII
jgi:ferrochelatase